LGNDIFIVDSTGDIITEFEGEGDDTVLSSVSYVLWWNIENLTLTGTGDTTGTGNGLSNVITGNSGNNSLNGGSSNDTLYGGAGNDTLIGGGNSDALYGGLGDDDYGVEFSGDRVIEAADQGTDQVRSSITYTLGVNLENLILEGTGNIDGTGNGLNNIITGNSGKNVLSGGGGEDSIYAGDGNDLLYGGDARDDLTGEAGDDTLFGGAECDALSGGDGNDLVYGGDQADDLGGDRGDDFLFGGDGDDRLDGGDGNNTLSGGLGSDIFLVDSIFDAVVESAEVGTDRVLSSITYVLTDHVEILQLMGEGDIGGTGNGLNNSIIGNIGDNLLAGADGDDGLQGFDGNDRLEGGNGSDTLDGGAGNDTLYGGTGDDSLSGGAGDDDYVVQSTADSITELANEGIDTVESSVSYTLSDNVENLTLNGVSARNGTGNSLANTLTGTAADNALTGLNGADRLFGNDGNDTLYGGAGADVLFGGDGADLLKGGGGGDVMTGGDGNDSYYVDSIDDQVNETGTSGHDRVYSLSSFTLSQGVEDLKLIGSTGISGTGNALDNSIFGSRGSNALFGQSGADTLYGRAGEDTLDGGDGADRMAGGADNDTYVVDNAADVGVEYRGKGSDVVKACVSYALSANVEALELTGTVAINGTGNGGGNRLTGNAGDNDLTGLGGHDTLIGGDGDDHLAGGSGNDELTGGTGADVFVFDRFGGLDHVTDFFSGQDHIQISANLIAALGGAQALRATCFYAASGAVTGHDADDRLVCNTSTGALYVDVDGSGKRAAVQIALLDPAENAVPALSFADFIFS
jgi:Ca2+-binding RTX toxin-like protein